MGATIKGSVLGSRKRFVLERFGQEALDAIIASLDASDREVLSGILLPSVWYPMETQVRFDAAIVRLMGDASEQAFRDLGRESASHNLERFQSPILRGRTPMTLLRQTPTIYRLYYGSGRREFIETGPCSGIITTYDAEGATAADCFTVMGWHERALEIAGASTARVTHPVCVARGGPHCRYELSWTDG